MGFGFRKSINLGFVRFNFSKSGVGYSFGFTGFRVGKDAKGRNYRNVSIPGTGIFHRQYSKSENEILPEHFNNSTGAIKASKIIILFSLLIFFQVLTIITSAKVDPSQIKSLTITLFLYSIISIIIAIITYFRKSYKHNSNSEIDKAS
jgi:hypothetical protein